MVTTNNAHIYDRIFSFKDHGKTFDSIGLRSHSPGFRWLHDRFGSNFRLTEFQSAIGRIQLRLPSWTQARTKNALFLAESLRDIPLFESPFLLKVLLMHGTSSMDFTTNLLSDG